MLMNWIKTELLSVFAYGFNDMDDWCNQYTDYRVYLKIRNNVDLRVAIFPKDNLTEYKYDYKSLNSIPGLFQFSKYLL